MSTVASGFESKTAIRLIGSILSGGVLYPSTPGTPTPDTLGAFDQAGLLSESLSLNIEQYLRRSLEGSPSIKEVRTNSIMPAGSIEIGGNYASGGLLQLLAAGFGYEKIRNNAATEYPIARASGLSSVVTGNTGVCAAGTLVATGLSQNFSSPLVGDYVRLEKLGTPAQIADDYMVRRITAINSTTSVNISPNWTTTPPSGVAFSVARAWDHYFELAPELHTQLATVIDPNAFATDRYLCRAVCLCIDKRVGVYEWQFCFVNKLMASFTPQDGLKVTAEVLPFTLDIRTASRNSDASVWAFSGPSYLVDVSPLFAECVFKIGAFSTSVALDSSNNLGIAEFNFTIDNKLKGDDRTTASTYYRAEPARNGTREVYGSLKIHRYSNNTYVDYVRNQTNLMADILFTGPNIGGTTQPARLGFEFHSLYLKANNPNISGPELVGQPIDFICVAPAANPAGMLAASTGIGQSEVTCRWTHTDPFNRYMNQDNDAGV